MVILAHDDKEIPEEETIPFNLKVLNDANVKKYLQTKKAIGCIFIKVFGLYVQSDLHIMPHLISVK